MARRATSRDKQIVLEESGFRCGVPTCRTILPVDIHHLVQISDGGGNEVSNLLPLCPNCHALHHRGTIPAKSLKRYKREIAKRNPIISCEEQNTLVKGANLCGNVHTRIFIVGEFEVIDKNEIFTLTVRYKGRLQSNPRSSYGSSRNFFISSEYIIEVADEGEFKGNELDMVRCICLPQRGPRSYDIAYKTPLMPLQRGLYKLYIYEHCDIDLERSLENVGVDLRLE